MHTMCLLRCNGFGPVERDLTGFLSGWFGDNIVALADERGWTVDTGETAKLALTDAGVGALGLYPHPAWPWRCGDYGLIAARAAFPDVRYFWLVETDVYFNYANAATVFAPLELSDVDLISVLYRPGTEHWLWNARMAPYHTPVYACHFPLVRVSARLIDAVAACRRRMTRDRGAAPDIDWPNDEAVTATMAHAHAMRTATLAELLEHPAAADTLLHSTHRLYRRSHLRSAAPDNHIYHPAYDEARFCQELEKLADQRPDELETYLARMQDCVAPAEARALRARAAPLRRQTG